MGVAIRWHHLFQWTLFISMCSVLGCAGWLPGGREPETIKPSLPHTDPPKDSVGVETVLVRLSSAQALRLGEMWPQIDEQVLSPEKRIALDRNGLRAGKAARQLPAILDQWVRESERRREGDALEQAGLAADVSTFAQLWRCRPNTRKEITIRNLTTDDATLFYNDGVAKGATLFKPHFLVSLQATPFGDSSATLRITPEVQHGETHRKVVAKDYAIRTDDLRDSMTWNDVAIELRVNQGDCIIIGPTNDARGLGEHFFHCRTKDGELQPVLMLVRLSESRLDDAFEPAEVAKSKRNLIDAR